MGTVKPAGETHRDAYRRVQREALQGRIDLARTHLTAAVRIARDIGDFVAVARLEGATITLDRVTGEEGTHGT